MAFEMVPPPHRNAEPGRRVNKERFRTGGGEGSIFTVVQCSRAGQPEPGPAHHADPRRDLRGAVEAAELIRLRDKDPAPAGCTTIPYPRPGRRELPLLRPPAGRKG